jgi:hypothetical protein
MRFIRNRGERVWHLSVRLPDRGSERTATALCGAAVAFESWQEASPQLARPKDRCTVCTAALLGEGARVPVATQEAI